MILPSHLAECRVPTRPSSQSLPVQTIRATVLVADIMRALTKQPMLSRAGNNNISRTQKQGSSALSRPYWLGIGDVRDKKSTRA